MESSKIFLSKKNALFFGKECKTSKKSWVNATFSKYDIRFQLVKRSKSDVGKPKFSDKYYKNLKIVDIRKMKMTSFLSPF